MTKQQFFTTVSPFTMTSKERIFDLFDCMEEIRLNNIDGDIVECGVWKGGNILGIIEYLHFYKMQKNVWLFDTFNGMTQPEDVDIDLYNRHARVQMSDTLVKALSPIEEVKQNLSLSSFPAEKLKFVIGDVSETLTNKENIPKKISLLRLDTDWYKSTKDELHYLYPKLINGGILIVDDYGHWQGSKKAVDEYFKENVEDFVKIDYTGIKLCKKQS